MLLFWLSPFNWWPHRALCALWTRHPIGVKVAMGCRTEPASVHITIEALFLKKKKKHLPLWFKKITRNNFFLVFQIFYTILH